MTMVRPSLWSGLLAAALAVPALLAAQTVTGTVVELETGHTIAGAGVQLIDEAGGRHHAVLSRADGTFEVRATRPGRYRLRAEMIGRQTVESAPFDAGPRLESRHELALPPLPIPIRGLEVTGTKRCGPDIDAARDVQAVWSEVEKALRATDLTLDAAQHRFRLAEYQRRRDERSLDIVEEETTESEVIGGQEPFVSLPPESLAEHGYIRDDGSDVWIYGPSTAVLLHPSFVNTHCFTLRRDDDREGMLGVAFEPLPGRTVADLTGVLWLREDSGELRSLEFAFENVPSSLMRGDYRGQVDFLRLEGGGWVIERWWLRSPDAENLNLVRERAAEILEVVGAASAALDRDARQVRRPARDDGVTRGAGRY